MKSLLQTRQWAALRQAQGWEVHEVEDIFVLEKKLPMGKNFLYVPEIEWAKVENNVIAIRQLAEKQSNINDRSPRPDGARDDRVIFIRLEILDKIDEKITSKLTANGFIKAFEEVQPEWRQIIDITKPEEEILAMMKEKGRYNIRVAQKHGIKIENPPAGGTNIIDDFYKLFRETAKRDGFEIRPKQYFEKLMQKLETDGLAEILIAKYNDIPVAAEIVTYYGDVASYLYGASSSENRNTMAPYLLHFEAMKRAKEKGCKVYDLLAVNPENEEKHKFAGIGRFKRQFGGKTVNIVGSWDYVCKPTWYKIFKMAETFRRK